FIPEIGWWIGRPACPPVPAGLRVVRLRHLLAPSHAGPPPAPPALLPPFRERRNRRLEWPPQGGSMPCQGLAKGGPASPGARRFRGGRGRWVAWKPDRRRGRPAGRGELDPGGPSRQGAGDQAREDRFH